MLEFADERGEVSLLADVYVVADHAAAIETWTRG